MSSRYGRDRRGLDHASSFARATKRQESTAHESSRSPTLGAAEFLGIDDDVGTVEVGKRADLLLLDASPLDSLDALRSPAGVMVRGAWLPREALTGMLESIRSRGGL